MPARPVLAKLTRPRLRGAVPRERLFRRLDEAREQHAAVCVTGPPGAGKTTLVASWLETRRIAGIWFQVDPGDGDLPTFFHYLGKAAESYARRGQAPLPALTPEYREDVAGFSRRFFRDLFARLPAGACIVLDNCQEVGASEAWHEVLARALGDVPGGMLLVMVSRQDLPETYARPIAHHDLAFVDSDALRFTREEASALAAARSTSREAEVDALLRLCDGWAAGLTLMLEDRRRGGGPSAEPAMGPEALFAYFAAQIYGRVPARTRRFLAATSFLPFVPVSVARELTAEPRTADILEDLHRRHLFTHRRPGGEPVYAYHALFRHFLQSRAATELGEARLPEIASRAARLLEAAGSYDEAFELFRQAADWKSAVRLAERHAEDLLSHGRGGTLRAWIECLPEPMRETSPWLRYWFGTALAPTDPAPARAELERAWSHFRAVDDHTGQALAAAGLIDTSIYEWCDFHPVQRWVAALGDQMPFLRFPDRPAFEQRVTCSLLMGMLYAAPGHPGLVECLERVTQLLDEALDDQGKLDAATVLLAYCGLASDADRGRAVAERGVRLASLPETTPFSRMWWHIRLGLFLALTGDTEDAIQSLDLAESIATDHGFGRLHGAGSLIASYRATAAAFAGDLRACERDCRWILRTGAKDRPMPVYHRAQARLYLAWIRGDEQGAASLCDELSEAAYRTGNFYVSVTTRAYNAVGAAVTGNWPVLGRILEEQRRQVRNTCFSHYLVEADLVEAWAMLAQGHADPGAQLLRSALRQCGTSDRLHMSIFRWTRLLPELLAVAAKENLEREIVSGFVRDLRIHPPATADESWPWAVRVRTFGAFEVHVHGLALAFAGKAPRKPLALLKAIIALGAEPVPMARLADALWPGDSGDAAQKALDVAIGRLRKLLDCPQAIVVASGTVSIDPRLCWVDAWQFQKSTNTIGALTGRQDLEQACALYRGRFLPADTDEPWTVVARESFRARFLQAVEALGLEAERNRCWDRALELYRRGIEADELAESLYQGLMRCHEALGSPAEAMAAYRRLRQLLSVVLGMAPSARSQSLARELRERFPSVGHR